MTKETLVLKKSTIIVLVIVFYFSSCYNTSVCSQALYCMQNPYDGTKDGSPAFTLLSPHNGSRWTSRPAFIYSFSGVLDHYEVWLNSTKLDSITNNTELPVYYRGYYNLTVNAIVDSISITQIVFFEYVAPISVNISYTTIYTNTRYHINSYRSPTPVYNANETIIFYAHTNERNDTLHLKIYYGNLFNDTSLVLLAEGSNYTWINSSCIKLIMKPPKVKFTWHMILFVTYSMFDNSAKNITFVFNRVVRFYSIIYASEYAHFLNTTVNGYVKCTFVIITGLLPIVNISIYLDNQLIKQFYYPNGSFFPQEYVSFMLDTTQYSNGNHHLDLYATELFNITKVYHYILSIYNAPINTHIPNTNDSPFKFSTVVLSLLVIALCSLSRSFNKMKTKVSKV